MSDHESKAPQFSLIWGILFFVAVSYGALSLRGYVTRENQLLTEKFISLQSTLHLVDRGIFLVLQKNEADISKVEYEDFKKNFQKHLKDVLGEQSKGKRSSRFEVIFFDETIRLDESLRHFDKLLYSYHLSQNFEKKARLRSKILILEEKINEDYQKLESRLLGEMNNIRDLDSKGTYIVFLLFSSFLGVILYTVYFPWRKAFAENREESQRLKNVLSSSESRALLYSWELDIESMMITRSHGLSLIFGDFSEDEDVSLASEMKHFSSHSRRLFLEKIDDAIENQTSFSVTVEIDKGRYKKWLNYQATYYDKENKYTGTVKDVTSLESYTQSLKYLIDQVDLPLVVIKDDEIVRLNQSSVNLWGFEDESYKGVHWSTLFPFEQMKGQSSLDILESAIERVRNTGRNHRKEMVIKTTLGERVSLDMNLFELFYESNYYYVLTFKDDSYRRHLERELLEANNRSLHDRRKKVEYISHYNTLMTSFGRLLETKIAQSDGDRNFVERVRDLIVRAENLWEDNIAYSVDSRSTFILVALDSIVDELQNHWSSICFRKSKKLNFSYNKTGRVYWLDVDKMKTALNRIIMTAMSDEKQDDITISISIEEKSIRLSRFQFSISNPGDIIRDKFFSQKLNDQSNDIAFVREVASFLQGHLRFEEHADGSDLILEFDVEYGGEAGVSDYENETRLLKSELRTSDEEIKESIMKNLEVVLVGDRSLTSRLCQDFIGYYPMVISDLYMAIKDRDRNELEDKVNELYSVLAYFPYFKSIERTVLIKKLGYFGHFERAEKELDHLIHELKLFEGAIDTLLKGDVA